MRPRAAVPYSGTAASSCLKSTGQRSGGSAGTLHVGRHRLDSAARFRCRGRTRSGPRSGARTCRLSASSGTTVTCRFACRFGPTMTCRGLGVPAKPLFPGSNPGGASSWNSAPSPDPGAGVAFVDSARGVATRTGTSRPPIRGGQIDPPRNKGIGIPAFPCSLKEYNQRPGLHLTAQAVPRNEARVPV